MTAFARRSFSINGRSYSIEIQSVNRKTLEVICHYPRAFQFFEQKTRQIVGKHVTRGNVIVRINTEAHGVKAIELPKQDVLAAVYNHMLSTAKALSLSEELSLPSVYDVALKVAPETPLGDEDELSKELQQTLEETLIQFVTMKKKEGAALQKDLKMRLAEVLKEVQSIEKETTHAPVRFQKRLEGRFSEIGGLEEVDFDRLHKEVALLVERIDINEEVSRLHSHTQQFKELIEKEQERHGRTLEFLLQEMHREANTIGSKSQELTISQGVVKIKTAIDRMREQVQNIE